MPTIDCAFGLGRKIGTNADFTTSIGSSSESSDSDFTCCLIGTLLADDGGLDDDGRDEAGESRDVFRCSGWPGMVVESFTRLFWM